MLPRVRWQSRSLSKASSWSVLVLALHSHSQFALAYTCTTRLHGCAAFRETILYSLPPESLSTRRRMFRTISSVLLTAPAIGMPVAAQAAVPTSTPTTSVDWSKMLRPATEEQPQIPLPSSTLPFDKKASSSLSSPAIAEGTKFHALLYMTTIGFEGKGTSYPERCAFPFASLLRRVGILQRSNG
jgi:hypothetical protein